MSKLIEASFLIVLTEPIHLVSVSDSVEDLLGFKAAEFISGEVSLQGQTHLDDDDISKKIFSTDFPKPFATFNIRIRHHDGRIRCIKGTYTKEQSADGHITLDLLLQDAKSLWSSSSEAAMMTNFKAMMENTDDYIYFKDRNHVFTGASQTLVDLTDPSESWTDLLGQTDYDVFSEEYADIYYHLEKLVFSGVHVAHEEQETLNNNGEKGWIDNRKYPMHDENGQIIGLFGIARDITENKKQQQEIEQLAFYDPLTGLPNRRLLMDRIQHALTTSARSGRVGAILFLDLDHFKTLNDTLGHDVGDILLQQVAERLKTCVRAGDTVARFGGDEFIIMLEDLSLQPPEAISEADRIAQKILKAVNQAYTLKGKEYLSSTSIGITLFCGRDTGSNELIKQADIAMYQAKNKGRNGLRFFDSEMLIEIDS